MQLNMHSIINNIKSKTDQKHYRKPLDEPIKLTKVKLLSFKGFNSFSYKSLSLSSFIEQMKETIFKNYFQKQIFT